MASPPCDVSDIKHREKCRRGRLRTARIDGPAGVAPFSGLSAVSLENRAVLINIINMANVNKKAKRLLALLRSLSLLLSLTLINTHTYMVDCD